MGTMTQVEQDSRVLVDAFRTACELTGISEEPWYGVLAAAGIDATLAILGQRFNWSRSEASYRREKRTSFSLGTSIEIRMTCRSDDREPHLEVNVTWASGGGAPGHALAVLTHHMDVLKGASQAEVVLAEAVRYVRTTDRFRAAMVHASAIVDAAAVAGQPVVEAAVAARRAANAETV